MRDGVVVKGEKEEAGQQEKSNRWRWIKWKGIRYLKTRPMDAAQEKQEEEKFNDVVHISLLGLRTGHYITVLFLYPSTSYAWKDGVLEVFLKSLSHLYWLKETPQEKWGRSRRTWCSVLLYLSRNSASSLDAYTIFEKRERDMDFTVSRERPWNKMFSLLFQYNLSWLEVCVSWYILWMKARQDPLALFSLHLLWFLLPRHRILLCSFLFLF